MLDVLAALTPPGVMAAVVIAFVVWLFRTQRADKEDQYDNEHDGQAAGGEQTNR